MPLGMNSADNREAKDVAASDLEEGFIRKEPSRTSTCFIGGKTDEEEEEEEIEGEEGVFEAMMDFEKEEEEEEGGEEGFFVLF